jgi:signal transduction histidine kinase
MAPPKLDSPRSITWLESPRLARLVHPALLQQPTLERLRAKLLAILGILLTTSGPLIASGYFRKGELVYGGAFLGCTVLGMGTFSAIRFVGSTRLSSHLGSLALWIGTLIGTYALGGPASIAARWFAVIPVVAAVFGGARNGLWWFAIAWLTYVALTVAPSYGVAFPEPSEVADDPTHLLVTMTTFMLVVLALFGLSELLRIWLVRERQETEVKLEAALNVAVAASETKDRFMAMMSHELRTPLNAIIGYAELLVDEMEDDGHDAYIKDAESIRSAGRHLLSLISDILAATMLDTGRLQLRVERFALAQLLTELLPMIRPAVRERDNTFHLEVDPTLADATLASDASKLRQILVNLLGNAAKFTEGGDVTLRVTPEGDARVCFAVVDTGIGVAPDLQENIWREFVQADDSSTRVHGGIGLGLALVKRLTTLLGGEVTLASEAGRGSTFRVVLPRVLEAAADERLAEDDPERLVATRPE